MTRRTLVTLLAATALVAGSACGFGGQDREPDGGGAGVGPGLPSVASAPQLVRDSKHHYRVVNLHQYNGQPGGALDIYPATQSDLTRLGSGVAPVASGLAYGQASDPLQPGGVVYGPGEPSAYGLGVLPHAPTEVGSANLTHDIATYSPPRPWQRAIVVLGGTGNGLNSQTFYDSTGPDEPNAVPAAQPGKISLMIDSRHAGDPNGPNPVTGFWLAGTGAGCLTTGQTVPAVNVLGAVFVVVDPATTAVGFWHTTSPNHSVSSCTGPPAFTVGLPALAAGSRAALLVYGLDADHLAGVVVPFDA